MCPTCRAAGRPDAALELGQVLRSGEREVDEVIEGVLLCPAPNCRREHPVIDGIPIIVADIRSYASHQLTDIRAREDLSPVMTSLLGDCAGPGSELDRTRYQLSSYARSHYGDLDAEEPVAPERSLVPLLDAAVDRLAAPPAGLWLDTGCAVGRATFELAARTREPTLGIDLNFAMLRLARRIARTGQVTHPLRRLGIVYRERSFSIERRYGRADRERVDFWACDATALPFAAGRFDGLLSLNLVDCTASPLGHLMEIARVLRPGGQAILTTPYDWSVNAAPIEGWIGGHSQRSDSGGDSVAELRRLLSRNPAPSIELGLTITAEVEEFPWYVYVHERATMEYLVHAVVATRAEAGEEASASTG